MCRKPKFSSDSVPKNRIVQKLDIHSDGFPLETAHNMPFKLKVAKSNCACIKCADKECFKT